MRLMVAGARVRNANQSSRARLRVGGNLSEAWHGPEPNAALVGSGDSSSACNAASQHCMLALNSVKSTVNLTGRGRKGAGNFVSLRDPSGGEH